MGSIRAVGLALAALVALLAGCQDQTATSGTPLQTSYQRVVKAILPTVVQISGPADTGSGVVFDSKGDIVTNAHVVGKAKSFEVTASDSSQPLKARLVGIFAPDDLAVIRASGPNVSMLKPARWADSARAQVGTIVLAVGAPYGLIDSVTPGIVSATGRTVTGPSIPGQPPTLLPNAIQTSAAINSGNSGGALVLLSGKVLGIPSSTATDPLMGGRAAGIGFAIPANTVREIAAQLASTGHVTHSSRASLQITGSTHTSKGGSPDGVTVVSAQPAGAAANAGIGAGDIVTALGGAPTPTLEELDSLLTTYAPGDKVAVTVVHNGDPKQVQVTLGSLTS
jgi:S1-C subfamily serine protease